VRYAPGTEEAGGGPCSEAHLGASLRHTVSLNTLVSQLSFADALAVRTRRS
jgi:hypothetical protein